MEKASVLTILRDMISLPVWSWEHVSKDKKEVLATVVQIKSSYDSFFMLRLKGLDPEKIYVEQESGNEYSGAYLMNAGLNLTHISNKDGSSYRYHFIAK